MRLRREPECTGHAAGAGRVARATTGGSSPRVVGQDAHRREYRAVGRTRVVRRAIPAQAGAVALAWDSTGGDAGVRMLGAAEAGYSTTPRSV